MSMRNTKFDGSIYEDFSKQENEQKSATNWVWRVKAVVLLVVYGVALRISLSFSDASLWSYLGNGAIVVSKHRGVRWYHCDDIVQCGTIEVPLDYTGVSSGIVKLSIARYPASNQAQKLGSLFLNPGGPGESGVGLVFQGGQILDLLLSGKYDIVSWDPRGVNSTSPRIECFDTRLEEVLYDWNSIAEFPPDAYNLSAFADRIVWKRDYRVAVAREDVRGALCANRSADAIRHAGSTSVARDLERLATSLDGPDSLINYWGFSYGTVIGTILVNMFPDRVGRVILDGVLDPIVMSSQPLHEWPRASLLIDAERTLDIFYKECIQAWSGGCSLAAFTNASSSDDLAQVVDKLLENLHKSPMAVAEGFRPGVLTSAVLTRIIYSFLSTPLGWWKLSDILVAALSGDGAPALSVLTHPARLNSNSPPSTQFANRAIIAGDMPSSVANASLEAILDEIAQTQRELTPHFADVLSVPIATNVQWDTYRFYGPWNHTLQNEILIIGNSADPITPLRNAKVVNSLLAESSRLVIQDGPGHCSIAQLSLCTNKAIREYLLDGALPRNGLVCPVNERLFPPHYPVESVEPGYLLGEPVSDGSTEDDLKFLEISRALREAMGPRRI